MRVALVHDFLTQNGGAEKVLRTFHKLWPAAPIFVLRHNRQRVVLAPTADIRETWLKFLPGSARHFRWFLPLLPSATAAHNLSSFDVIISSSSLFAKNIRVPAGTLHISYCYTPARFLWVADNRRQYFGLARRAAENLLQRASDRWRRYDIESNRGVHRFIAISNTVAKRIKTVYQRDSLVLYPPVAMENFFVSPAGARADYFLTGGRLVPYKRFDIVVVAFNRLRWPLKIFGAGPEFRYLKSFARPNIEFLGAVSEADKAKLMSHAQAFIHPQHEDFGITAVEAMASGRPVIAYAQGGASETVTPGVSGVFYNSQTWESLLNAVLEFNPAAWDSAAIRASAERFSAAMFQQNMERYVAEQYRQWTAARAANLPVPSPPR